MPTTSRRTRFAALVGSGISSTPGASAVPGCSPSTGIVSTCYGSAERTVAVDDPLLESLAAAALFRSAQDSGLGDAFERAELGDAVRTALGARPEAFRDVALLVDLHDHL